MICKIQKSVGNIKKKLQIVINVFFENDVKYASVYVEEFEGEMAKVVFQFVDDMNNTELADSYVIRNRVGEQYFTPEIPSIENYSLVLDKLPDNGAGKITSGETVVTYRYTRVTDDTDHLAGINVEGHIFKHRIVALVAEGHVLYIDLALDSDIDRQVDILNLGVLLEYLEHLRKAGQEVRDRSRDERDVKKRRIDDVRVGVDLVQRTDAH